MLLFFGCAKTLDGTSNYKEQDFKNSLDIMTWNLNSFNYEDLDRKVFYLDSLVQSSNVDIIAIQEMETETGNYFSTLIDALNDSESQYIWAGYKPNCGYICLAYIINTSTVNINDDPYQILDDYSYDFARLPYVLEIIVSNKKYYIINNHFKAFSDATSENRRKNASIYLQNYIDTYLSEENVIVLGDLNDELTDPEEDNVFWNFISAPDEYLFVDMEIANGLPEYFSHLGGSHLDHILVTNELFDYVGEVQTVLFDFDNDGDSDANDWWTYEHYITDHRPLRKSIIK